MMKQMRKSVIALAMLASIIFPAMAATTEVKVSGVVMPSGCTPTLSGGGVFDYGDIRGVELSKTDYTPLSVKQLDFTLQCAATTKVAVIAVDGRRNTTAGLSDRPNGSGIAPIAIFGLGMQRAAGLGLDGKTRIGGYVIRINKSSVLMDGKNPESLLSANRNSWLYGDGTFYHENYPWISWGSSVPEAFKTLTGKLEIQAYLNKASELDLSKAINLDGLTTLELVYL